MPADNVDYTSVHLTPLLGKTVSLFMNGNKSPDFTIVGELYKERGMFFVYGASVKRPETGYSGWKVIRGDVVVPL